ncbi:MAG TPA: sulfate adenylyltransferase subunit CysD, partial [Usitatibacter sp.]|nr:sulfate adenylyltransferase subunit CysD [Usitatibacter sp.]
QRPELWRLYNLRHSPGESFRVFPLSNWTERDVWRYIEREGIEVVPLYLAAPRPVVRRGEGWLMVDDARMRLAPGEKAETRMVRFRTLGCYPLTYGFESNASSVAEIVEELSRATTTERQGRAIDHDAAASMERKKSEGYF